MEDTIYLTPRQILAYLCDLESKVPRHTPRPYEAKGNWKFDSDRGLEREAESILSYVGLDKCTPTCSFAETPDGVAGMTHNTLSPSEITITVSEAYRGKTTACRAILAHEICHKVIFMNGIDYQYPAPEAFNDTFVDLCTIYIGLGQTVLDGYIDDDTDTLKMGYLKPDMYRQAFKIMQSATGMYGNAGLVCIQDPLLEDALDKWQHTQNPRETLKQTFMKEEAVVAKVNRDILLLRQILRQVYMEHGKVLRRLSETYSSFGLFDDTLAGCPLRQFRAVYETMFERADNTRADKIQESIGQLFLDLADEYAEVDINALDYTEVLCPNCGSKSRFNAVGRDTIIKCPNCGTHFCINQNALNIPALRLRRAKAAEAKAKEDEDIQRRHRDNEAERHRLENLAAQQRLEASEIREKAFNEGQDTAIKKAQERYKYYINRIPRWLRLLIGNRLPKEI